MIKAFVITLATTMLFASQASIAASKTHLNISSPWEVNSYEPSVSGSAFYSLGVMETLVDATVEGVLIPGLATKWEMSDDGLSWRFSIREGVSFHDDSLLTANVAANALQKAFDNPGMLKKAPILTIHADQNDVVVTLDKPFSSLPALMTHNTTVISAPSSINKDGAHIAAIGTGPFAVDTFTPPQGLNVKRFDNYWGDKAKLETVSYLATSRAETRALLAESGDADLVFSLDPSGFTRLAKVDSVKTKMTPIPRVVTLKLNAGHAFLNDPRARRALSLAMDRIGIATAITRFPEGSATQLFPPALDQWHNEALEPLYQDVKAAKNLLAELGWTPGDDGILNRNGERFSLILRTFTDRPELPLIAAALQDQWRTIGVELNVSIGSYSEIPAGHKDGSLHVALYARNYGITPDPIGAALQDFGAGGGDWGAMNWENANVAQALEKIATTSDPVARNKNIATVVESIHNELPLIPVVWYQHIVSVAKDLQGYTIDPLERKFRLEDVFWDEK
ncbi:ABC transporter substrate-binding protein [Marinomonas sp. 2405UD68-3]|uniref:ABC transporter substrate-binding protein n=1 Tax=Marinomonas sp. 2405UD68-3 TaxID=3391835 RepID=UPI0039C98475